METPRQIIERVTNDLVPSISEMLGISEIEACAQILGFAEKAKELASTKTDDIFRQGDGDTILTRARSDPQILAWVEKRRTEGVTDDDIRWFWNMCAFEQAMIGGIDQIIRTSMYEYLKGKGWVPERAGHRVRQLHAIFGDFDEGGGDDRPLPHELKRRIVQYIERYYGSSKAIQQKTSEASSFNALVRAEIRKGSL